MNRHLARIQYFRDDALFSVEHNGQTVVASISRKAADLYLYGPDRLRGSVRVYLTARPLEGRKAAWRAPTVPRMPSMRVSAAERAKLLDKLTADGIHHTAHDTCAQVLTPAYI